MSWAHTAQSLAAGWTEERTETLKRLALDGYSASDAAKVLRITRNAAVAKSHRIGVHFHSNRGDSTGGKIAARKGFAATQRKARQVEIGSGHVRTPREPKPPKPISGVTLPPRQEFRASAFAVTPTARHWLTRLSHECRWPVGEPETPADQWFCCAPAEGDYCPAHTQWGFRPQDKTKRSSPDELARMARRYA